MAKAPVLNLNNALLQGMKESPSAAVVTIMPTSEMPMVLTLDEVAPNPDNPRTTRNPKYDDIKESIRARGLDTVPKVTKNPDIPGSPYIFSDGGNTRHAILQELYAETRDERFYRFHVLFKPWPGRLKCLVGHLAENDVRGELTFIDKALGIRKARSIHEEILGRSVTLRELSELLQLEGYPIHNSLISRMEHTVDYLYPYIPRLLNEGMGRPQIVELLSLRGCVEKVWKQYSHDSVTDGDMKSVFGEVCRQFDDPELYSFEMFRDELIGHLIKALPHPSLNYERWLIELDPKVQNQRMLFGEPEVVAPHLVDADRLAWQGNPALSTTPDHSGSLQNVLADGNTPVIRPETITVLPTEPLTEERDGIRTASSVTPLTSIVEVQNENSGNTPVLSFAGTPVWTLSDTSYDSDGSDATSDTSALSPLFPSSPVSSVAFANVGLEPVVDIWEIPALQDDIEHLQDMAYRLVFEIAEAMGCEEHIREDKGAGAAGFSVSEHGSEFVLFLAGLSGSLPNRQFNMFMFCLNFFGSQSPCDTPVFDDVHVVKTMRLIRVIRRLRELQRNMPAELNDGRIA
ncbi:hypothetical protein EJH27_01450 [Salmonella enterica subsp. enterica serovar Virchow]|nr:hypothetical protein [Salmonella enterica subsp. enterica serovar Virchow]